MIEMFPFMLSLSKHSEPLFRKLLYPRIHRSVASSRYGCRFLH